MASNINTSNINTNYPVAGEDNDTQGFRDNFDEIKKNFDSAETEISDLQNNTAKTNQDSDFFGNKIVDANIDQSTETTYNFGNIDTDQTVDFRNGHYQILTVDSDVTLTLDGWPAEERYAKLTVSLINAGVNRIIEWGTIKDGNPGAIKRNQGFSFLLSDSTEIVIGEFPVPFVVDSETDPIVVEFWTIDGGETVHANLVGKFA